MSAFTEEQLHSSFVTLVTKERDRATENLVKIISRVTKTQVDMGKEWDKRKLETTLSRATAAKDTLHQKWDGRKTQGNGTCEHELALNPEIAQFGEDLLSDAEVVDRLITIHALELHLKKASGAVSRKRKANGETVEHATSALVPPELSSSSLATNLSEDIKQYHLTRVKIIQEMNDYRRLLDLQMALLLHDDQHLLMLQIHCNHVILGALKILSLLGSQPA